jgi:hypothetical protein
MAIALPMQSRNSWGCFAGYALGAMKWDICSSPSSSCIMRSCSAHTIELGSSFCPMLSQPHAVVDMILQAANGNP